jgi:hypothetical protein
MKPVLDTEKEYGLVLEGGGAKGAYQIGAWKALKEAGIRIKGIRGIKWSFNLYGRFGKGRKPVGEYFLFPDYVGR